MEYNLRDLHRYPVFKPGYKRGKFSNEFKIRLGEEAIGQGGRLYITSGKGQKLAGHFVLYFYDRKVSGKFNFL